MAEILIAIGAVLLIAWGCSGDTRGERQSKYYIEESRKQGVYQVRETETGRTRKRGTWEECQKWINENDR